MLAVTKDENPVSVYTSYVPHPWKGGRPCIILARIQTPACMCWPSSFLIHWCDADRAPQLKYCQILVVPDLGRLATKIGVATFKGVGSLFSPIAPGSHRRFFAAAIIFVLLLVDDVVCFFFAIGTLRRLFELLFPAPFILVALAMDKATDLIVFALGDDGAPNADCFSKEIMDCSFSFVRLGFPNICFWNSVVVWWFRTAFFLRLLVDCACWASVPWAFPFLLLVEWPSSRIPLWSLLSVFTGTTAGNHRSCTRNKAHSIDKNAAMNTRIVRRLVTP